MYYPQLQTAADTLPFHAGRVPEQAAIRCEGREVTYGALHRESNRIARALRAHGVGAGARVGYLGKESERYYEIFFGCAKSGVVLVPINWRLAPDEVDHVLRDSGAELLFVERDHLDVAEQRQPNLPALRQIVEIDRERPEDGLARFKDGTSTSDLDHVARPEDPVVQLYTSGTTGLPKGVVLAHRSFFGIRDLLAEHGVDWLDWYPQDRSLISIPGFHVAGIWWAMQGFNAGVLNVCMRMFTAHDAVTLIREAGITTTLAVPSMLQMMLAENGVSREDFATLRMINYGGSPISETLLQRCQEIFDCDLSQMYGLTESGNCAICLPPEDHVPGSPRMRAAGKPYPGVSVKIVDSAGRPVPTGEVGEICVRTPAVMLEYWGLPEATAKTLVDGWLHTGDAGYLDADGYVYIADRIKDVIIIAGENVYPAEVENALCKHPAVAEAAVVGIPDQRWGEAAHAFVTLRPGSSAKPRELMLFVRELIAEFKVPTRYEIVDVIPRNPSGKILRRKLREQFWADQDRKVN
ncbi:long-chain acyl-CoA synthetase [Saccharopolyspora antimicrobica]|uniref:Long-chain acyl-CoA synthetase n=1 Tax=Saccharopolyspora antimicrobica TaxID=455193 RepID=A0A1I5GNV9_9PSEU|nr:fatty acid--CoA ligase [Saccharopolyspora antimicrobica]RKT87435.1 long-chain acyl-CoA synthetase [Saccharopolyspora antimicrobica]SFO37599.1 long-chain acyl-CoA synthetase [Saccharopolyspora antimicrobica]